ncbi:hypothetical protein ETB97_010899 [Aspergillus alliaceus]|uniref:Uncharacterized protein n=1 Tax=Petromyces alliaceus TaxID=209559 RepID=A0A8H6E830_PETAA|nr:hypothetical protein ETB97_010899 [Aspergillus burnettii]
MSLPCLPNPTSTHSPQLLSLAAHPDFYEPSPQIPGSYLFFNPRISLLIPPSKNPPNDQRIIAVLAQDMTICAIHVR